MDFKYPEALFHFNSISFSLLKKIFFGIIFLVFVPSSGNLCDHCTSHLALKSDVGFISDYVALFNTIPLMSNKLV